MAKLFDLTQTERPIPKAARGVAHARSSAPLAPGIGLESMGRDIERGAEEITRAQLIEEDRVNTLRAEEAHTELKRKRLELTMGEDGFSHLKGSAAVNRPVLKDWGKRFEDAERVIAGTLANDTQRERFKARSSVQRLAYDEDILRHLAREGDVYAKEVYDGRLATARQMAGSRWDSQFDVTAELFNIKNAVDERAERYNWAPEYRAAVLQEEHSKVHQAVITQAIANGNNAYAKDWFEKHREAIDPPTARVLAKAVEDGIQKDLAAGYRSEFLAGRDSIETLTALGKRVSEDKTLDLDRQNAILGPIHSRIDVLQHRQELAQERRLRLLERGINDLNGRTRAGFEPGAEEFLPFIAAAKGTELEGAVRQSIQLAAATRAFRLSLPQEQEQTLQDLEARERARPGSVDHKLLADLRQIHEAQTRLIKESPVSYAYRQGLADPVRIDWVTLENQGEQIAQRMTTARGMQLRGAELKPLLPEEVGEIRARLSGASPQDKMLWFGKLRAESGGDPRNYSAMMAQLAPDEPVLALAGEYAGKGRTEPARLMLEGQDILRPGKKADGTPDQGKLWPLPPDTELRRRFQSLEGDAFAGNAKYRNMTYQATQAIYAKLTADAGDNSQVLHTERFEQAFRMATGGVTDYRGHNVLLPYGMEERDFRRGLATRIEEIERSGRLAPGMTGAQLRELPLDPIGDGRYAFRVGDARIGDKNGKPVIVNFNLEPEEVEARPFRGTMLGAPSRAIPPWERQKPRIENPDGTFSTERTITIEADGKHYNIPTIVGGRERSEDEAVRLWRQGSNPEVGSFATRQEAERAAQARSDEIGRRGR